MESRWSSVSLADLAERTADAVRAVVQELPAAKSVDDALAVVAKDDRQVYLGVALLAVALLVLALTR